MSLSLVTLCWLAVLPTLVLPVLFWARPIDARSANSAISSGTSENSIPRSTAQHRLSLSDPDTPPWNPSLQIDDDGFLTSTYFRIPGEWESLRGMHFAGKHNKRRAALEEIPVRIRQVPGDGNCLFNSLSVCLHRSEHGVHFPFDDWSKLQETSRRLRHGAIDYLASKPRRILFIQGRDRLRAKQIIDNAAAQYKVSADEYLATMRKEGSWGGGPEIVALSNLLRRPIHVYELHSCDQETFALRRMGCFGSPKFDRREALHILSADYRFPDVSPVQCKKEGNHFLAIFPENTKRTLLRRRGGADIVDVAAKKQKKKQTKDRILSSKHVDQQPMNHHRSTDGISAPVKLTHRNKVKTAATRSGLNRENGALATMRKKKGDPVQQHSSSRWGQVVALFWAVVEAALSAM